jgi:hypothetical protein
MSSPDPIRSGSPRSSFDRVLGALEANDRQPKVKSNGQIQARCPLHEDVKASLSVSWKNERGGMTRLHCHSCGAGMELEILEALGLGLTDRFDQPLPPRDIDYKPRRTSIAKPGNRLGPTPNRIVPEPSTGGEEGWSWQLTKTYDYVDADATLLYQVLRMTGTHVDGRTDKRFDQRRPNSHGGWIKQLGQRRVLRHLPAVIETIAAGLTVWLAEGEKDDGALNQLLRGPGPGGTLGIATTNNNGAAGIADEQVEQLRGADVVIVVDRDAAGYQRALKLSNRLGGVATSTRIVLPAVDEPKADAHDHVTAGFGLADFVPLTVEAADALVQAAAVDALAERAERNARLAQIDHDESAARLERATAGRAKAPKTAEEEHRFAVRWAHEAVRNAKAAGVAADSAVALVPGVLAQLAGAAPLPARPADVVAAAARAEEAFRAAQRIALEAWEATGAHTPQVVSDVLLRTAPSDMPAPVAAELPPPANVVPFPDRSGGGGGGSRRTGSAVIWTRYERLPDGVIVEHRPDRNGNLTMHGILSLDARVIQTEVAEVETEDGEIVDHQPETTVLARVLAYTHPETGETVTMRVAEDRARMGDWLANVPEMGIQYDSSPRGRAKIWDAIRLTSKNTSQTVVRYRSTGWRELPGHGWTYVHAGGGICADGQIPLSVRLPSSIKRVELCAPESDPGRIRDAFDAHSRALMTRLSPHVGAVMAGTAYRSVLGWTSPVTMLFGVPGSYKSAVAALVMHHFGTRWERQRPGASMSGRGATHSALQDQLYAAKDTVFFADDFAPDKSPEKAAIFLAEVGRMQANQERRDRHDNQTDDVKEGGKYPRGTLLATSEVKASTVSGQERINVVDLAKGELDLSTIIDMSRPESRYGRNLVMSSMVAWMAKDLPGHKEWATARTAELSEEHRAAGFADRVAEPLAELGVGWELMARFLTEVGAYSQAEATHMLADVHEALHEAGRRGVDPDSPSSVAEISKTALVSALSTGRIHLTLPQGLTPPYPRALQVGWRRVDTGTDHKTGEEFFRCEARGEWVGVMAQTSHGHRMHVDPSATVAAILGVLSREGTPLMAGRTVIQRALAAAGYLRTEQGRFAAVVPDPHTGEGQRRMWDLDADAIFGIDPPTPPQPASPAPGPVGPEQPDDQPGPDEMVDARAEGDLQSSADQNVIDADEEVDEVKVNPATGQFDTTVHEAGAPCVGCGEPTIFSYDGISLHPCCELPVEPGVTPPARQAPPLPAAQTQSEQGAHDRRPPANPGPVSVQPAAADGERWAAAAAVVTGDELVLPDGTRVYLDPQTVTNLGDLAELAATLRIGHGGSRHVLPSPGQLLMTAEGLARFGVTVPEVGDDTEMQAISEAVSEAGAAAAKAAIAAGWNISTDGRLRIWSRIWRTKTDEHPPAGFQLVMLPLTGTFDAAEVLTHGQPEAQELARRAQQIADALGMPWGASGGATGLRLLQALRSSPRALAADTYVAAPAALKDPGRAPSSALLWCRSPEKTEIPCGHIHAYDANAMYLAALGAVEVGVGDPTHHKDGVTFNKKTAGLWRIEPGEHDDRRLPDICRPGGTLAGTTGWYTTPIIRYLYDVGQDPKILEAYTWPATTRRYFDRWYEIVRDGRAAALDAIDAGDPNGQALLRAVKATYTAMTGRFARSEDGQAKSPLYRPDWRLAVIATANANLLRKIRTAGQTSDMWPVAVSTDEVFYLSDDPNPAAALPAPLKLGSGLGQFKVSRTAPLTEQIREALTSRRLTKLLPLVAKAVQP